MYWTVYVDDLREVSREPANSWDERAKRRGRRQARLIKANVVRIVDERNNILWEESVVPTGRRAARLATLARL